MDGLGTLTTAALLAAWALLLAGWAREGAGETEGRMDDMKDVLEGFRGDEPETLYVCEKQLIDEWLERMELDDAGEAMRLAWYRVGRYSDLARAALDMGGYLRIMGNEVQELRFKCDRILTVLRGLEGEAARFDDNELRVSNQRRELAALNAKLAELEAEKRALKRALAERGGE